MENSWGEDHGDKGFFTMDAAGSFQRLQVARASSAADLRASRRARIRPRVG